MGVLAINLDSLRPNFYTYGAALFIKSEEPKRAIMLMAHAISLDSTYIDFYIPGGKYAYLIKDYDQALAFFNQGLGKDMFAADLYYYKGMTYKDKGDTTKAMSSFQTCVSKTLNMQMPFYK